LLEDSADKDPYRSGDHIERAAERSVLAEALFLVRSSLSYLHHLRDTGIEALPPAPIEELLPETRVHAPATGTSDSQTSPTSPTLPAAHMAPAATTSPTLPAAHMAPAATTATTHPSMQQQRSDSIKLGPTNSRFKISDRHALTTIDKTTALNTLQENDLNDCQRCKLSNSRQKIVFGTGNPDAAVMFVGEGPGPEEDSEGSPFVGPAGQLLDKIIAAMGIHRADTYMANVVMCHPPNGRIPEPDEIVACESFLHRQIDIVGPRIIVALGTVAGRVLLRKPANIPLNSMRHRWHVYRGVPLRVTFHPTYLLSNPAAKRDCWEDIKKVMARLGLKGKA